MSTYFCLAIKVIKYRKVKIKGLKIFLTKMEKQLSSKVVILPFRLIIIFLFSFTFLFLATPRDSLFKKKTQCAIYNCSVGDGSLSVQSLQLFARSGSSFSLNKCIICGKLYITFIPIPNSLLLLYNFFLLSILLSFAAFLAFF